MTKEVPYNVVGLKVTLQCVDNNGVAIPLTDATNLKIKLRPESGATSTAVVKTATLEGTGATGELYCLTAEGDIDAEGDWLGQAYYEKGTYEGHTIPVTVFTVVANLDGT